jgi:hypothetical protein
MDTVAYVIATCLMPLGFGQHIWNVNPENLPTIGLQMNMLNTLGILSELGSKNSFAITLLRLTDGSLLIGMNLLLLATVLLIWVQCTPISKLWYPETPGTCISDAIIGAASMVASSKLVMTLPPDSNH